MLYLTKLIESANIIVILKLNERNIKTKRNKAVYGLKDRICLISSKNSSMVETLLGLIVDD